jgi:hypothetical protein
MVRNEARVWVARERLYADALTREQAAARADVGRNEITNLATKGDLLAIDEPDGTRLPRWQFDADARRGRLEGIGRVAAEFPGRMLGLSSWMGTLNPVLAGARHARRCSTRTSSPSCPLHAASARDGRHAPHRTRRRTFSLPPDTARRAVVARQAPHRPQLCTSHPPPMPACSPRTARWRSMCQRSSCSPGSTLT